MGIVQSDSWPEPDCRIAPSQRISQNQLWGALAYRASANIDDAGGATLIRITTRISGALGNVTHRRGINIWRRDYKWTAEFRRPISVLLCRHRSGQHLCGHQHCQKKERLHGNAPL